MKRKLTLISLLFAGLACAQISVESITPLNGTGLTGTFTGVFRHTGGVNQSYLSYLLLLPTPNIVWFTARGSCLVEYNRISNGVRLINDAGDNWLGRLEGEPAGPAGKVLANQICSVDTRNVTRTLGATDVTLTVPISFTAAPAGPMGSFLQHFDVNGKYTGMTQFGNWTANPITTLKPGPYISSIGASSAYAIAPSAINITSGHTSGLTNVSMVNLLVAEQIVGGNNRCHIIYFQATQEIKLINDAGNGFVTGSPLHNSVCAIGNLHNDIMTASGNSAQVSIHIPMEWNPDLSYPKKLSIWGNTFDNFGNLTHWIGAQ